EKKALDAVEEAYDRLDAERNKGLSADPGKVSTLEAQASIAAGRAQSLAQANEYSAILQENGAADFLTGATSDNTLFQYSLPSNRLELWFLMESQRLLRPAFREFYQTRDTILDENRGMPKSGQDAVVRSFLAAAFAAHPYRNPQPGWP